MELYQWQKDLFDNWSKVGYRGICKARTGSGKTLAGIACIDRYTQMYPAMKVLVVVPSAKIAEQWKKDLKSNNLDVPILSYTQAVNKMYRGGLKADCLILDECHRISPEKSSSQVMKLEPTHVLGLSATPGGSQMILGKPFYTVDWDEARLCPFYVHYARFNPSPAEAEEYARQTNKMQCYALERTKSASKSLKPGVDSRYDWMVRQRRAYAYEMKSRIPNAISVMMPYILAGKRTIVFAERNDTLKDISKELTVRGVKWSVCSQWMDTLKDFEAHRTNVLLLAKKLREGWNDPTLEVEILVSPTTRELSHTQVVGRVCRLDPNNPNKEAHIVVLIANGTSDENLIVNNDFPPNCVEDTSVLKIAEIAPGLSERKMIRQWF